MLANGITLGHSATAAGTYTKLANLKTVPDIGENKERVENSGLDATNREYEFGIGDTGELQYTFKFENTGTSGTFRKLRGMTGLQYFEQTWPDGTKCQFPAYTSTTVSGGGVNSVVEITLTLAVAGSLTFVDPS